MDSVKWFVVPTVIAMAVVAAAQGGLAQEKLVEGGVGIAAKYSGDLGIETDPSVVFVENFETGSMEEIGQRWGHLDNKDDKPLRFTSSTPGGSSGKRSLEITATRGQNTGGSLSRSSSRATTNSTVAFMSENSAFGGIVSGKPSSHSTHGVRGSTQGFGLGIVPRHSRIDKSCGWRAYRIGLNCTVMRWVGQAPPGNSADLLDSLEAKMLMRNPMFNGP